MMKRVNTNRIGQLALDVVTLPLLLLKLGLTLLDVTWSALDDAAAGLADATCRILGMPVVWSLVGVYLLLRSGH